MDFHTLSGDLILKKKKEASGYTINFPIGKVKSVPFKESIMNASPQLAKEVYYDGDDIVMVVSNLEELKKI